VILKGKIKFFISQKKEKFRICVSAYQNILKNLSIVQPLIAFFFFSFLENKREIGKEELKEVKPFLSSAVHIIFADFCFELINVKLNAF